jgi:hypothetical protein
MRAGLFVLAIGLSACGFEHGRLSGGGDDGGSGSGTIDAAIDASGPAWWHAGWNYRMPITIVNASTATLPIGYQVGISHDFYAAPCTGTRNDVRFIYGPVTELNRAFDDVMPPYAWFQLASPLGPGATSAGEYFMYCGNPSPTPSPSNPSALFELYDAFESAQINMTTWTVQRGANISNGRLVLGGGTMNDNGVISKTASFGPNHAVDIVAIPAQTTTSSLGFWFGFEGSTTNGPPYAIWWTFNTTSIGPAYGIDATSTPYEGTPITLTTAPHYFSVEHYGKGAMFRYDDVAYDTQAYDVAYSTPWYVRLWNYNTTPTVAFELVRVRQAVDPPPTVTVGAPQMKF